MKCILLQGAPGIGKTTLIKKVVENINKSGITADGFFTEEVKVGRGRIGFDIVTLKNERGILARKGSPNNSAIKLPQVGQYTVYLNDFEKLALPVFNNVSLGMGNIKKVS
ncbi:unnamed protein product [Brassicogethes aeneus]|uniref:Cancer-related nucleoside-triphosphatase homolog n=1 Tax=Brassicogethes aeneus TaxID=1431903 RepID=A0A9P0B079_BRAAE|nr:unnamed protein product [Brassicogethes aeneus]